MELWIRSQDKEDLVKAYNFRILNESYIAINVENRGEILDYLVVGKYATKERALEVLDEIQNVLLLKDMYFNDKECCEEGWKNRSKEDIILMRKKLAVYEMPQE